MAEITEIGIVKSSYSEKADPYEMRQSESVIKIYPEFEEGLFDIESNRFLHILFHFNKSDSYRLKGRWYFGDEKGVFACRSPNRPGAIGLTTVELLERNGNQLRVRGLDAIDGSPVLDIKPLIPDADQLKDYQEVSEDFIKKYPRSSIMPMLKNQDIAGLLLEAGRLHGHYCPGLALGTAAAVCGLHKLTQRKNLTFRELLASDGMEEFVCIIEVNSCFADGIQFVSGCTFGNNGLIYRDLGKTAATFCLRDGCGVRVSVKPDYGKIVEKIDTNFYPLFNEVIVKHSRKPELLKEFKACSAGVAFRLIKTPFDELFNIESVETELPGYAPIRESVICSSCRESVMGGKQAVSPDDGKVLCKSCASEGFFYIDGTGICGGGK